MTVGNAGSLQFVSFPRREAGGFLMSHPCLECQGCQFDATFLPRSHLLDVHASGSHGRRRLRQGCKVAVQLLPQGGLLWPRCEPRDVLEWAVLEYVRSVTGAHLRLSYFHLIVQMCPHPVMACSNPKTLGSMPWRGTQSEGLFFCSFESPLAQT